MGGSNVRKTKKYIDVITTVVEYVERNINERKTLDDVSHHAGLSKFHLHRMFKSITGHSMMEYVRNRKLTKSISELLDSDLRVIDVAFQYGFEHEQSYIRAFKSAFGVSPGRFRCGKQSVAITDKLNVGNVHAAGIEGIIIEPILIVKPSFSVIGLKKRFKSGKLSGSNSVSALANRFFETSAHLVHNAKSPLTYMGVAKKEPSPDFFSYIAGVEVWKTDDIPPGLTGITIPTNTYAVFKYIGRHSASTIRLRRWVRRIHTYSTNGQSARIIRYAGTITWKPSTSP